jgi:transposase
MISDELRANIRRLFFAEHFKVGTIVTELGVHRDAVLHAINAPCFANVRHREKALMLDPYRDFVRATLDQYPRLRSTRLFEMIRERGYSGSVFPLRRYVKQIRPVPNQEAFFRLNTLPGEEAQVDWGHFGKLRVGNFDRPLSCFVMVLSWSRATFARFTLDQTLESFLRCHVEAFQTFRGAPRSVLYDNLKSVVLERQGDLIRFHPRILELSGHYHFAPKPVGVARGNEKGRVERRIRDLRESFFAARSFGSLQDLNRQLDTWIAEVAHPRRLPGSTEKCVLEAFNEERSRLLGLPSHPFPTDSQVSVRSGKTPYVRFDRNDYSIPHTLVKRPLTLFASELVVRILDGDTLVARHPRSWSKGQQIEDETHLLALTTAKRNSRDARGKNRLFATCPHAEAFLGAVALHGGHLGGTTSRLLRLLDEYGHAELDVALQEAHSRCAFHAQSVAHVLDQRRRARGAPVTLQVQLPNDPRVQNLIVIPHSLDRYDRLGHAQVEPCSEKELP